MTDALIEKVEMMLFINQDESPRDKAAAVVFTVLDHFSEPGNIPAVMQNAAFFAVETDCKFAEVIAAVMRAARDEVSRG